MKSPFDLRESHVFWDLIVIMSSVAHYLFFYVSFGGVGLKEEQVHGLAFLIGIELSLYFLNLLYWISLP